MNRSATASGENWQSWVALVALTAALLLPLVASGGERIYLLGLGATAILAALLMFAAVLASLARRPSGVGDTIIFVGVVLCAAYALLVLPSVADVGSGESASMRVRVAATAGFWALVIAAWTLAWLLVRRLAETNAPRRGGALLLHILVPVIFGAIVLFLWEVLVRGFAVPLIVLPPPSLIWARITTSLPTLWVDFEQTFLKAALTGYVIGNLSGFTVALVADRIPFLRRGLLPIGNLAAALPIVGIAPIMVMWFGFDWPSKAAVVVAMTFFPMLVNTVAGLAAADDIQRDLMRTYAADHRQTLVKLRLLAALPFIFNALKINTTLALIGAIVAEFFGTPIRGMGFRISTEVGRMNTDMVWAEIAVAAVAGSVFYGVIALAERAATFWHPSFRQPSDRGTRK